MIKKIQHFHEVNKQAYRKAYILVTMKLNSYKILINDIVLCESSENIRFLYKITWHLVYFHA